MRLSFLAYSNRPVPSNFSSEAAEQHLFSDVCKQSEAIIFAHLIEAIFYPPTAAVLRARFPNLVSFTETTLRENFIPENVESMFAVCIIF
jgi:hypothetical protein